MLAISDTNALIKTDITALEVRLYKFLFAAMSAQTALIVGLLQLLK